MRGRQFLNFPAFDHARNKMRSDGYDVISPADLDRAAGFDATRLPANSNWHDVESLGFDVAAAIDRDLDELKRCDAIYMLRGWQDSLGATAEHAIARWRGLEVSYQEEGILEEAIRITRGDRQAQYGPPDQDFERTAKMWSALKGVEFEAREVAMFMICLKLSRETHQRKRDNWVDTAGYASCGAQCR
jgi:hypothetical protein